MTVTSKNFSRFTKYAWGNNDPNGASSSTRPQWRSTRVNTPRAFLDGPGAQGAIAILLNWEQRNRTAGSGFIGVGPDPGNSGAANPNLYCNLRIASTPAGDADVLPLRVQGNSPVAIGQSAQLVCG